MSALHSENGFSTLPIELYPFLFSDLDPQSLLSLIQTCRILRGIVSQKRVWEEALLSVCRYHGLFEPSFALESMDLVDLQRAAFGPARWHRTIAALRQAAEPRFTPVVERKLELNESVDTAQIIPGGRYVISMARSSLTLWDLGSPSWSSSGKELPQPKVVSTFREDRDLWELLPPALSNKHLRGIFYADDGPTSIVKIIAYEIGPLPENTAIRKVAELTAADVPWLSRVYGDRAFIVVGRVVAVWDFTRSLLTSWTFKSQDDVKEFIARKDILLAVTSKGVATWTIPPFQEIDQNFVLSSKEDAVLATNVSCCRIFYDDDSQPDPGCTAFGQVTRSGPASDSFVFDLAWSGYRQTPPKPGVHLARYKLNITDQFHLFTITQISKPKIISRSNSNSTVFRHHSESSEAISTVALVGPGQFLIHTDVGAKGRIEDSGAWQFATIGGVEHGLRSVSLCPSSGRMVGVCDDWSHLGGVNGIHVLDYF